MTRTLVLAAVAVLMGGTEVEAQSSGRVRLRDRPFFTDPLPSYPSGYALGRSNFGANPENAVMYPGYGLGVSSGGPGYTYRGYHSYSPSYGYGQSGIGFGPVWGGGYGFGWGMGISPYRIR